MGKRNIIPEINGFNDLLKKFEYDLNRYKKNNHSYELMDCIMTLNSLPDWIRKSSNASENLRILANEKIIIMKGHGGFKFDKNQIEEKLQKIKEQELMNVRSLIHKSQLWKKADDLRNYIKEVEVKALKNNNLSEELKNWFKWANQKADWYDPLIEKEDNLLFNVDKEKVSI